MGLPTHLQLPSLPDVPSLFLDAGEETPELRVVRATTASLLYALKSEGYPERILKTHQRRHVTEINEKRNLLKTRSANPKPDRSCLYCRLFHKAVYDGAPPRAIVVSHSAHVQSDFDPATNIAEAGIEGYQVLVPQDVALDIVQNFHPLRWPKVGDEIFKQTDEAFRPAPGKLWTKPDPVEGDEKRGKIIDAWKDQADHYLYEDVEMPWNGQIKSIIRNILKIGNFYDGYTSERVRSLRFTFSLESCLESNFGIRLERGGLDIDGGSHLGEAEPFPEVGLPKTLRRLSLRDLAHMRELLALPGYPQIEDLGESAGDATGTDVKATLGDVVDALKAMWQQQPWLVTISTSKRLRYTAPGGMPLSLWTALTWMAPAQLFMFINRVVSEAHVDGLKLGSSNPGVLGAKAEPAGARPDIPPRFDASTFASEFPTRPSEAPMESAVLSKPGKSRSKRKSLKPAATGRR